MNYSCISDNKLKVFYKFCNESDENLVKKHNKKKVSFIKWCLTKGFSMRDAKLYVSRKLREEQKKIDSIVINSIMKNKENFGKCEICGDDKRDCFYIDRNLNILCKYLR